MNNRFELKTLGTTALVGALLVASACGSDAVDDAEDASDEAQEQVDEVTDELDEASGDLASVLEENGLENIASAVEEIDVAELVGTDEFTFFAPDDEAFQSLGADDIADLLTDPEQLDDVLRRHVVAETIDAAELAEMSTISTEGGIDLDVTVDDDVVMVGDATVVRTDIEVDHGVVHIVDTIFIDA